MKFENQLPDTEERRFKIKCSKCGNEILFIEIRSFKEIKKKYGIK